MEERRKEIRTMFDTIPEEIRELKIKTGLFKDHPVSTVDISSIGMAFIAEEAIYEEIKNTKNIFVCFTNPNRSIKAKTVYAYPIVNSKVRIGIIFEEDGSIRQYHDILKKSS